MNLELTIGYIYKVTSPNNKVYVGQTINPKRRKQKYGANDFKGQKKLWSNCQKYEWNPNDTFEIIEECFCGEEKVIINNREIFWIEQLNAFGINGLNCSKGGAGHLGCKISEETKAKIRKANLGRKHTIQTKNKIKISNARKRKILCLNNNKIYDSIHICCIELKLESSAVSKVCSGKRKHTNQYKFIYINET